MPTPRSQLALLAALTVAAGLLQVPVWDWLIEDAAISFAYARNVAEGLGVVPYPGAERVEGYSNPLWVAVLAGVVRLGGDPFQAARWLGLGLGMACVPAVWAWARPLGRTAPLLAAAVVATSAQWAIWAQSGLENALFGLLVALGGWRVAVGDDDEVAAPLLFGLLALTRPEGIAYAGVAGLLAVGFADSRRGASRRVVRWAQLLAVPLAVYHVVRYAYFAQALPATYHAKLGAMPFNPLAWGARAWRQLRQYSLDLGVAPLLPLIVLGASGTAGRRGLAGFGVALVLGAALLPVQALGSVRAAVLIGVATALPVLAVGRREARPALVAACMLWCGLLFCLRSGGDWMHGHRWISLLVPPAALLLGAGLAEVAARIPGRAAALPVVGVLGLLVVPQVRYVLGFHEIQDTTPLGVKQRLDHWLQTARTLGLDRRLRIVDHDMGGMLWFGGDVADVRDTRGLVDWPFALHGRPPALVLDELFRGPPFDFAHGHASTKHAFRDVRRFRTDYVEIPGYPAGSLSPHQGQFVRRDLFLRADGPPSPVELAFESGVVLDGVRLPSPQITPGSGLFVELGLRVPSRRPVKLLAFLARGTEVLATWDLPPAYGWVPVPKWRPGEVFVGRFSLPVPAGIPEGRCDLGFVLLDEGDRVLPAAVPTAPPALARGEARLRDAVTLVDRDTMFRLADADLDRAVAHAGEGRCEQAEAAWELALRHRTRSGDWRDSHRPRVTGPIAACWAERARGDRRDDALLDRVADLRRGRAWDPRSEDVDKASRMVASEAWKRGMQARAVGDDEAAFTWFEACVHADPSRAWARRYAEEARSHRLGLHRWLRDPEDDGLEPDG